MFWYRWFLTNIVISTWSGFTCRLCLRFAVHLLSSHLLYVFCLHICCTAFVFTFVVSVYVFCLHLCCMFFVFTFIVCCCCFLLLLLFLLWTPLLCILGYTGHIDTWNCILSQNLFMLLPQNFRVILKFVIVHIYADFIYFLLMDKQRYNLIFWTTQYIHHGSDLTHTPYRSQNMIKTHIIFLYILLLVRKWEEWFGNKK